jgi:glycosyltransferase involved in cell wall biosynthesis
MNIAIDCRMSGMSGIGVYLDNIIENLIIGNNNDQFLLIGKKSRLHKYSSLNHCSVLETNIPIFSIGEIFKFPLKEINACDVFYSPNYNIPFGIKIPIFSTIHDVVFLDIRNLTHTLGFLARKFMLWRAIRISEEIFTVSNFSKQRIIYHFKNSKDIVVTNNGISTELKNYTGTVKRPYEFPYVLFIGNIKKHKGLDILIEAYKQACQLNFKQKLVIVGNFENFRTTDKTFLQRIAQSSNQIVFTGMISNEELYQIIEHATMLIQPSRYEGFGIPPLEALYLGCPALIADIPVFKEIYDSLPVRFFNINNTEDLMNKLLTDEITNLDKEDIRKKIDKLYNFKKSASLVLDHLRNKDKNIE